MRHLADMSGFVAGTIVVRHLADMSGFVAGTIVVRHLADITAPQGISDSK